jgi:hypothetical protein
MNRLLSRKEVALLLAALVGPMFFLAKNYSQYSPWIVLRSLLFFFCAGLAAGLAFLVLTAALRRLLALFLPAPAAQRRALELENLLFVTLATALLTLTTRFAWQQYELYMLFLAAPVACIVFWAALSTAGAMRDSAVRAARVRIVVVFLSVFALFSAVELARNELSEGGAGHALIHEQPVRLRSKPNIYLFMLESFHDRATIRDEYSFDVPEFYTGLEERRFQFHDRVIANYHNTLNSIASLLNMRHHYWEGQFGNEDMRRSFFEELSANAVFRTVKENGYQVHLYDESRRTFRYRTRWMDTANFEQLDQASAWVAITNVIDDIIPDMFRLSLPVEQLERDATLVEATINSRGEPVIESFREQYPREFSAAQPQFFFLHFGASHMPTSQQPLLTEPRPDWKQRYETKFRAVAPILTETLDLILSRDPEALIILIGDHGAFAYGRYRETLERKMEVDGANRYFRENGFTPERAARNLAGVMLAIRWPSGLQLSAPLPDTVSHVNLFPYIFANLTGERLRYEDVPPSVLYYFAHQWVMAAHGQYLDNWMTREDFEAQPAE